MEITQTELKRLVCFLSGRFPVSKNWWMKNKESVYKDTQQFIDKNLKPSDNSSSKKDCQKIGCAANNGGHCLVSYRVCSLKTRIPS